MIFILHYFARKKENTKLPISCPISLRGSSICYIGKKILHRQFMQSFFLWFFRYNWKTSDEKRFTSDSEKASQAVSVCPWVYSGRNLLIQKQKFNAFQYFTILSPKQVWEANCFLFWITHPTRYIFGCVIQKRMTRFPPQRSLWTLKSCFWFATAPPTTAWLMAP